MNATVSNKGRMSDEWVRIENWYFQVCICLYKTFNLISHNSPRVTSPKYVITATFKFQVYKPSTPDATPGWGQHFTRNVGSQSLPSGYLSTCMWGFKRSVRWKSKVKDWSLRLNFISNRQRLPMFVQTAPWRSAGVKACDPCSPLVVLSGDQTRLLQEILLHHSAARRRGQEGRGE